MRPFLLFALLASTGALWYARRPIPAACSQPIPWSVGALDPRFGIGADAVVSDAEAATDIWSRAAGRQLFVYDRAASLRVNLVYDWREANALNRVRLAAEEAKQASMHDSLDALKESFQTRLDMYNLKVRDINAHGGTSAFEAQYLAQEQQAVQSLGDSIHRMVDAFNARNRALDSEVARFNERGTRTFMAGEYADDRRGRRIDAFAFIGDSELTRLFAHEFGHAMGLGHNHDPESIMYEKNESGSLTPSAADLASLRRLCGP